MSGRFEKQYILECRLLVMILCSHVDSMFLALEKLLTFLVIGLSQVPRFFLLPLGKSPRK